MQRIEQMMQKGERMEWISVKDELPAIGEPVLVFDDASDMMFGFMSSDGYWLETGSELPCNVTHWMPLPKPPKE